MSKKSSNPVIAYFSSAWEEFGKVTWPTKEQAALLTAVTLVVSGLVVLFIAGLDLGFSQAYKALLNAL